MRTAYGRHFAVDLHVRVVKLSWALGETGLLRRAQRTAVDHATCRPEEKNVHFRVTVMSQKYSNVPRTFDN